LSLGDPCFNERKNLPLLIAASRRSFADSSELEVVLVDNGSSDGSSALFVRAAAQHPVIRSLRVEVNQGYGFGILSGARRGARRPPGLLSRRHADGSRRTRWSRLRRIRERRAPRAPLPQGAALRAADQRRHLHTAGHSVRASETVARNRIFEIASPTLELRSIDTQTPTVVPAELLSTA
jgi:glycosyltransferase involved in cell wall biosynthesis